MTQEFAEIFAGTVHLILPSEPQVEGLCTVVGIFGTRDIARLEHLLQHHIAPRNTPFGISQGIEHRRVLAQADERSRLVNVQVAGLLAEVDVGRMLDTHGIVQKVEVVKVHRNDLLLRKVTLQLDGNHPFYGLLQEPFQRVVCLLGVELLGQLLRDGRAASGALLPHHATLDDGTAQSNEVYAGMLIKPLIFSSHKGMHQVRRQIIIINCHPIGILLVPRADELTIGRINL